jgi:hypothetical protein
VIRSNSDILKWCSTLAAQTSVSIISVFLYLRADSNIRIVLPSSQCSVSCDGHTKYDPAASSSAKDSGQPFLLTYGAGETAGEEHVDDVFVGGYEVSCPRRSVSLY